MKNLHVNEEERDPAYFKEGSQDTLGGRLILAKTDKEREGKWGQTKLEALGSERLGRKK